MYQFTPSPLLFIFYINDVVKHIHNVQISLYADDTAFYLGGSNISQINNVMTTACNTFNKWCSLNRLTLKLKKCKCMILSNLNGKTLKALKQGLRVEIGNESLEVVNEFKYLGMIVDERLKSESHIKMIKQAIFARLITFKKIRHLVERREALLLFKSMSRTPGNLNHSGRLLRSKRKKTVNKPSSQQYQI